MTHWTISSHVLREPRENRFKSAERAGVDGKTSGSMSSCSGTLRVLGGSCTCSAEWTSVAGDRGVLFSGFAHMYTNMRGRLSEIKNTQKTPKHTLMCSNGPATPRWGCAAHSPATPFIKLDREKKESVREERKKGEVNRGWEVKGNIARQQQENWVLGGRQQVKVGMHKTDRKRGRIDASKERRERFWRCREGSH